MGSFETAAGFGLRAISSCPVLLPAAKVWFDSYKQLCWGAGVWFGRLGRQAAGWQRGGHGLAVLRLKARRAAANAL